MNKTLATQGTQLTLDPSRHAQRLASVRLYRWGIFGVTSLLAGLAGWMAYNQGGPGRWLGPLAFLLGMLPWLYEFVLGPRQQRWGATDKEVQAKLPGDEEVPRPLYEATRAITIQALPEAVWPWLAQMGWKRAGWYTFDHLDMVDPEKKGLDRFSSRITRRILTEFQNPQVGDLLDPAMFRIAALERNRALVMASHGAIRGAEWIKGDSSWTYVLAPVGAANTNDCRTRLIVRWRLDYPPSLPLVFFWLATEIVDFVMHVAQMRNIKQLAEQNDLEH